MLLLKYLREDPRWNIKSKALQHLHRLAKPGGHLWPKEAIESMLQMGQQTEQPKVLYLTLSKCTVLYLFYFAF